MYDLVSVQAHLVMAGSPVPASCTDEFDLAVAMVSDAESLIFPRHEWHEIVEVTDLFSAWSKQIPASQGEKELAELLGRAPEPEVAFPFDVFLFSFQFVGSGQMEDYASATEWEMREGNGVGLSMAGDIEDILEISQTHLNSVYLHPSTGAQLGQPVGWRYAAWVGIWKSSGEFDSVTNEYDASSEFIGEVDMDRLMEIVAVNRVS